MKSEPLKSYIVFPFHRVGALVGTSRAIVFDKVEKVASFASAVGQKMTGVAVLEKSIDPETGEEKDRLLFTEGAVPSQFPSSTDWTLRLH